MMEKQFNGKTKEDQINKTNYFCIMIEPAAEKRDKMRSFFSSLASDGTAKEKKSFPKKWGSFECFVTSSYLLLKYVNKSLNHLDQVSKDFSQSCKSI